MRKGCVFWCLIFGWLSFGYGVETSVYLLDPKDGQKESVFIRGIPARRLSKDFFFSGWLKERQWLRLEVQGLQREKNYVFFTGTRWVRVKQVFFYDTNNLPFWGYEKVGKTSFFLPVGISSLVLDVELEGHPLVIFPRVIEAEQFFQKTMIVSTHVMVIGILFSFFWGWYGVWAFRRKDMVRLWKTLNFLFLGILTYCVIFPGEHALSFMLVMMGVFGCSWTGYQLVMHPELRRPDMLLLHGLFLLLAVGMAIAGIVSPVIGFFLFGVAIHFNLILLIFYYQLSERGKFLPWHLFFLVSWIVFFWEMMGVWTEWSPLAPWGIVLGLVVYLMVECWELFKEIYLDKSLYQFYQNTNRLLKGYLAQSNRKLQETVVALKKESHQKAQLVHLYEIQQKKYRDLVENLSDWIWEMDNNLVITYTSPRIESLLGIAPEDAVKKSMEPIIGKEAFFILKRALQQSEGRLTGHLLSLQRGEHSVLLEVVSTPLMRDGHREGYRCIGRDVSQLILMRSDLLAYRQDFSLLFDQSPLAMVVVDVESMSLHRWNKRFEDLFPLAHNRLTAFLEKIGDPYAKDIYFAFKELLSQEKSQFFSFSLPCPVERENVWLVMQGYRLSFEGRVYLVLTIFPPEFCLFEKQWEWVASWPIPVVVMDKYGHQLFANSKAQEMAFSFPLPSPPPQEVSSFSYKGDGTVIVVPRYPLLYLVFGWFFNHTDTKQVMRNMLYTFPVPWVIIDKEFQVVEWHPVIFEVFHFQAPHGQFLSQMIKESGLAKQIRFSSPPSYTVVTAYLRNKREEVFFKEVYLFVFEEHAMLFFFDGEGSSPDKEMLPLFLHQLSLFTETLQGIQKEIQREGKEVLTTPPFPRQQMPELFSLTETERKILVLLVQGKTNAEIATLQEISEETVKGHLKRIFKKLGVSKRYQIIQRYHGLL
ncbi:MAG: LuxR C-terminal-related transcriptional regulator [Brevinematales bacterium]|nr:LuxR C-terminal-related transcriptional regulator [Brevinematales bacterium]